MSLSPEQLAIRSKGIGASEIAAVAGICPYQRPIDVWQRKMGMGRDDVSFHMERGTYLEPAIIDWASERHGWTVEPADTVVHPDHPVVIATPDALATPPDGVQRIVEVKCPGHFAERAWGEVGTDEVPDNYRAQVMWQMGATGLRQAYVVALMSGDIQLYEVDFNERLFGRLLNAAQRFWSAHVLTNTPPEPDGSDSYGDYLSALFPPRPPEDEPEEDGSEEAHDLLTEYQQADALRKEAVRAHSAARQRLIKYIGERAGIIGPFGTVTYRANKDSQKTDWKAIAKLAKPSRSVVDEHTKTVAGARVLRVKGVG